MEEVRKQLPDFDEWLANYTPPEIIYLAAYDPETGAVLTVGPDYSIDQKRYKNVIQLENNIAEQIISGEIRMSKCFIDATSGELEITEVKNLYKIDDVVHRIIENKWAEIEKPDIFVTTDVKNKKLKIELSEEFGGTKKLDEKFQPVAQRKIFWDGETILNFLITSYNDPHVIYNSVDVKLSELTNSIEVNNIEFPNKFSIYTRRLFKSYVLEVL